MERPGILTNQDHDNLDALLGHVLDDYRDEKLSKDRLISGLVHLIGAIDVGNEGEARTWLQEGRKFFAR